MAPAVFPVPSVQGNLNLHSGLLRVGSGNSNSGGIVTSSLNVGGTINIASGATLDNRPDYHHVQFQLNAGAIDSSGVLIFLPLNLVRLMWDT